MAKRKNMKHWFSITAKDCDFQFFRASGKGGQHRNKTDSAARCIHKASGAVGECTKHKEQKQNKKKAFERMAKTAEFQSWLKLKIDAGLGKVTIEEQDKNGKWTKRNVNLEEI